jgi:hypothetical protein
VRGGPAGRSRPGRRARRVSRAGDGAVEDGFTYPLVDDLTGDFVDEAAAYGLVMVSEAAAHRGRHGGPAGDLLRRLPTFEETTLAEILDVRRGLEGPLRVVVAGFSREVSSAAWDPGLVAEANPLFREKVESEVERIEHPYGRTARSRARLAGPAPVLEISTAPASAWPPSPTRVTLGWTHRPPRWPSRAGRAGSAAPCGGRPPGRGLVQARPPHDLPLLLGAGTWSRTLSQISRSSSTRARVQVRAASAH